MSTLIVAIIVVLGIAVVLLLLVYLHNRQNKRRKEKMLRRFSELGSEYRLSFTSMELLGNRIIGVDGLKGKVLFLENDDNNSIWCVIDLTEAKSCQVKKVYGSLNAGNTSERSSEMYLQTITLEFDLKKDDRTVALPIYQHVIDSIHDAARLEAKAKNWETMLLKMMTREIKA